jgi:hypothetical protein
MRAREAAADLHTRMGEEAFAAALAQGTPRSFDEAVAYIPAPRLPPGMRASCLHFTPIKQVTFSSNTVPPLCSIRRWK